MGARPKGYTVSIYRLNYQSELATEALERAIRVHGLSIVKHRCLRCSLPALSIVLYIRLVFVKLLEDGRGLF